jgi:cephalosporin hydroxylase
MTRDYAFEEERKLQQRSLADDAEVSRVAPLLISALNERRYSYNFDWLGLPIIQYPADIVAVQELIWRVQPQVVVETGVARGGSLALSASILELLGGDGFVVGVELELRELNRQALEAHPLAHRFRLVDGSSTDPAIVEHVRSMVGDRTPVLVLLDSNHTHDHVLAELEAYADFVAPGSYIVVFDTLIEYLPADHFPDRPWHPGNSPQSAVTEYLSRPGCRFEVDEEFDSKLVLSVAPGGYLRCVR